MIPSEIGKLEKLSKLSLSGSAMKGPIPTEIGLMSSLGTWSRKGPFVIVCSYNSTGFNSIAFYLEAVRLFETSALSGTLPTEVGNIANLGEIGLLVLLARTFVG